MMLLRLRHVCIDSRFYLVLQLSEVTPNLSNYVDFRTNNVLVLNVNAPTVPLPLRGPIIALVMFHCLLPSVPFHMET